MSGAILITALFMAIACIWIMRRRGISSILYPSSVFMLFSLADVLIPSIIWSVLGQQNNLPWLTPLTQEQFANGLTYYVAFYFVFLTTLVGTENGVIKPPILDAATRIEARLTFVALLFFFLNSIKLLMEINDFGGLINYALAKSGAINEARISGEVSSTGSVLYVIPYGTVFLCLAGFGFFYRNEFKRRWIFTYALPCIALIFAILNFFRGSILNFMFTFLFVEYVRARSKSSAAAPSGFGGKAGTRKFVLIGLLVLSIFTTYGAMRNSIRSLAQADDQANLKILPGFIKDGHGLLGVSYIVADFGETSSYLMGKTYFDMLMLPVPRSIYTDKPTWYGIDDITKEMGWPQSTQSAVTMPGEAFANFGIAGLVVAIPFAIIFSVLLRIIRRSFASYILMGPLVIFIMPAATNWMSFTGLMNNMLLTIVLYGLTFIFPKGKNSRFLDNDHSRSPTNLQDKKISRHSAQCTINYES